MRVSVEIIAMSDDGGRRMLSLDICDGSTPDDLLNRLDLPEGETYMTLINGLSVAPGRRTATRLVEGDKIVVFPPLKGG